MFNACLRYLFAGQCEEHAEYVFELANTGGYRSEVDIFLARAVLQLLAVENLRDAIKFYDTFHQLFSRSATGSDKNHSKLDTPLVNCVQLTVEVCKRVRMHSALSASPERYAKSLARDLALGPCMARIANKFFDVPPPKKEVCLECLNRYLEGQRSSD